MFKFNHSYSTNQQKVAAKRDVGMVFMENNVGALLELSDYKQRLSKLPNREITS